MVRYASEQRIFLYDTYAKYRSARNSRRKFRRKFCDGRVSSRQAIHTLMNKRRTTGLLIDKKQKHKRPAFAGKSYIYDIVAGLEHTPRKSLKRLAQENGVSKSSAGRAIQLLRLDPIKEQ
jgi:hypothetical protein